MTFFNKKEEVLDIQLTQHGKRLLSEGDFTPVYYAFFDDGVIYDSKHAGFDEEQNNTVYRIKNETPTLKTQHVWSGAETRIRKEDLSVQLKEDKIQSLSGHLGNGKIGTDKIPAWDLKLYQGRITNTQKDIHALSGSTIPTQQIPQVDVEATYRTFVANVNYIDENDPRFDLQSIFSGYGTDVSRVFSDGTFVKIDEENLLIDLLENNTDFEKGNFDIEIFKIEEVFDPPGIGGITERLVPLKFKKPPDTVINDILLDESEIPEYEDKLDPTYVEYYFDVFIDKEIETSIICNSVSELKSAGYRVETPFDCSDVTDKVHHNIYRTSVGEEDIECQ